VAVLRQHLERQRGDAVDDVLRHAVSGSARHADESGDGERAAVQSDERADVLRAAHAEAAVGPAARDAEATRRAVQQQRPLLCTHATDSQRQPHRQSAAQRRSGSAAQRHPTWLRLPQPELLLDDVLTRTLPRRLTPPLRAT
jgi:hypothetical protein